ncbi:zinc finger protein CONSTANS-LIKE 4-like [Argentina anserina]|uniref:zinc finger protein CONSTANS-LIKE 4-like n=1 Tax=Argentina anserina TaxID=57926 RepID=UPI0021765B93|nr:zinc finger protein CONSTANS-LIKE 4-like [Potentilla anserina]
MKKCELCDSVAKMYCESDQASLCWDCDIKVHGANFLVAKHSRTLLCHVCQSLTPWNASGPKLGPTVSVCESCVNNSNKESRNEEEEEEEEDDDDDYDDDDEDEEEEETSIGEDDDHDVGGNNGAGDNDGGNADDDEENQVVPWSSSYPAPPDSSSKSLNDEECCNESFSISRSAYPYKRRR